MYSISYDYNEFCELTNELYLNDPFYIPAQIPTNYKYFVVKENDKIISRACVIDNPTISYDGKKTLQIGYFESYDNQSSVDYLFDSIKQYAKENKFEYLIGPMNGSTWQKYRITKASEEKPFFLDNYNKSYYSKLFETYGFNVIANYTSTVAKNLDKDYTRVDKFENIYKEKGLKIRNFDVENFDNELEKIYKVSVDSFKNNFLYTPISVEEFKNMYQPIKPLLNPEWVLIVENKENEPLAFVFAFDNIYEKNKKSLVIKTLAKISDNKIKGIGTYLTERLHKKAYEKNYDEVIHALMHEKNISANISADETELLHEYSLYGVEL